jgi:hypothetical protein
MMMMINRGMTVYIGVVGMVGVVGVVGSEWTQTFTPGTVLSALFLYEGGCVQ